SSTRTPGPPTIVPRPLMTSILRALIRPVSPLTFLSTTCRSLSSTLGQSTRPDASMPHSDARLTWSMTDADSRRALDGMHPRRRHVPPRRSSRSTSATRFPSSAARRAEAYPPVPLPSTMTSYLASAIRSSFLSVRGDRGSRAAGDPRDRQNGAHRRIRPDGHTTPGWENDERNTGGAEANAARGRAPATGRAHGAVRRVAHADRVRRHAGRARRRAGFGGSVRPHAPRQDLGRRARRARDPSAGHAERRLQSG